MDIGLKISTLMDEKNLTKISVASKLGIARNTLDDYINNRTSPTVVIIEKLANIFKISICDFLRKEMYS